MAEHWSQWKGGDVRTPKKLKQCRWMGDEVSVQMENQQREDSWVFLMIW